MLIKKEWQTLVVKLKGCPNDFGLSILDEHEALTTQTLVSHYNIIPGTKAAREFWEAVQAHALEEGSYSDRGTIFGEGGLSALVYDRMVIYYGMKETTANLMTKLYYLTKGGITW